MFSPSLQSLYLNSRPVVSPKRWEHKLPWTCKRKSSTSSALGQVREGELREELGLLLELPFPTSNEVLTACIVCSGQLLCAWFWGADMHAWQHWEADWRPRKTKGCQAVLDRALSSWACSLYPYERWENGAKMYWQPHQGSLIYFNDTQGICLVTRTRI